MFTNTQTYLNTITPGSTSGTPTTNCQCGCTLCHHYGTHTANTCH